MEPRGFENLQTCIEKCTVGADVFYYDSRFGTKIDEHTLHPLYKRCFTSTAQPVSDIARVVRDENNFHISLTSLNRSIQTMVKFYPCDKTFVCRDFDPRVVIPAILASSAKEYLKVKDHPFYRFGYVADYTFSPSDLDLRYTRAANSLADDMRFTTDFQKYTQTPQVQAFIAQAREEDEIKRITQQLTEPSKPKTPPKKQGLAFANELDWYDKDYEDLIPANRSKTIDIAEIMHSKEKDSYERIQEPHSDSDCDSCGMFGVDDPDNLLPTITKADIEELETLFGTGRDEHTAGELAHEMASNEPMVDEFVSDYRIPRIPLKKLSWCPPSAPKMQDAQRIEYEKIIQEQARQRNEELIRLRELQKLLSSMPEYTPVPKHLIPTLDNRDDNMFDYGIPLTQDFLDKIHQARVTCPPACPPACVPCEVPQIHTREDNIDPPPEFDFR